MNRFLQVVLAIVLFSVTVFSASALNVQDLNESCYTDTHTELGGSEVANLELRNACAKGNSLEWLSPVNLTFGAIQPGEVAIGDSWMFVDSSLRPDLDQQANLIFSYPVTVEEPVVYEDGVECNSCNITHTFKQTVVEVNGFSNYSLQGQRDFTLYHDSEPELKDKVYQTVDLGNANRNTDYACIVQVFGRNARGDWVLVQTNPERKAVGNVLGDPDTNQPESLGYFPTKNGVANTYFRAGFFDNVAGYSNFNLVVQCSDTTQKLIYEEPITTVYSPAGRTATARGVWLTEGNNAFYFVILAVMALIAMWVGGRVWDSIKR